MENIDLKQEGNNANLQLCAIQSIKLNIINTNKH